MIGMIRAGLLAFVVLTVVYLVVSIYSRSMRREKLEKAWDSDPAREGAAKDERDAYIRSGMEAYRHSLRRKLAPGLIVTLRGIGYQLGTL